MFDISPILWVDPDGLDNVPAKEAKKDWKTAYKMGNEKAGKYLEERCNKSDSNTRSDEL